jgi:hypothetical protein
VYTGAGEGVTEGVGEGVGVGVSVGEAVGTIEGDGVPEGVADADAEAEVVVFAFVDAACDVLLAAWLLLIGDVQPAILTISRANTASTNSVLNLVIFLASYYCVTFAEHG